MVEVAPEIPGELLSTLGFWAFPVVGSSNDEEECADDVGLTLRGVTFAGDVVDSFCFVPIGPCEGSSLSSTSKDFLFGMSHFRLL